MASFLDKAGIEAECAMRPGLIPTAVDAAGQQVTWIDLEQFHSYQGFFHEALELFAALRGARPYSATTPLDILPTLHLSGECIPPTGFIFHAGRSGSTLLVKALARSRSHLLFGEAAAHNQIWPALRGEAGPARDLYRSLILAMGRRRLSSYRAHIIKFTSYNILRYSFIRRAFPDTPALFLFREPGQLLDSYRRRKPQWMSSPPEDLGLDSGDGAAAKTVESFFRAAHAINDENFRCMEYKDLTPDSLPTVLRFFRRDASAEDLRLMKAEFAWDAKSGNLPKPFIRAQEELSVGVPASLKEMYAELQARAGGGE